MKYPRIAIGNTIELRWQVLTNGEARPLEGRDLKLELVDPRGLAREMTYTVEDGNVITTKVQGKDQKRPGVYLLNLYENRGGEEQGRVDAAAFELVPHSWQAVEGGDGIAAYRTVELEPSALVVMNGSPYIQDGYWYIGGQNLGVKAEGHSPYIQDGYWYLNGQNLGVMAEGHTPYIQGGYWYVNGQSTGKPAYMEPRFDDETGEIVFEY